MTAERIALTPEVSATLATGGPIVALESTVIAQGLPWPANLETARAAEAAVRALGAVPATIAVLDGTIRIGLTDRELVAVARNLATAPVSAGTPTEVDVGSELTEEGGAPARHRLEKANRRDLAAILARGDSAATTVSATLWIARRFGLGPGVMATGGLGGVHRQAATSFDISTDLDELARADGALVVCSGLKSILDLPATLETLETRGVLVVGYRTDELPGFLARSSGLPLEHRVDSPDEAAALVRVHRDLGLPGAIVLTQLVPEAEALDRDPMQTALETALKEATIQRISGKSLTPFLLDSIRQATLGSGLRANCALLIANARLAGEIAVALLDSHRNP
jgi:pseudouridylate synthase